MLLILSTTFYFHYNIWGCLCSTVPFQYRQLKRYVNSSCYYHHQIRSIHLSHCYHIFPWLCVLRCLLHHILLLIPNTFRENREFVFIIIVQFMMSANNQIRFDLKIVFVYLYITPSHYRHCASFSRIQWRHLIKCLSNIVCRVCKIRHIISVIHYKTRGAVRFQLTHFPCDDWENIYTLSFIIIESKVWTFTHCLGLGPETILCAACLSVFLWYSITLTAAGAVVNGISFLRKGLLQRIKQPMASPRPRFNIKTFFPDKRFPY